MRTSCHSTTSRPSHPIPPVSAKSLNGRPTSQSSTNPVLRWLLTGSRLTCARRNQGNLLSLISTKPFPRNASLSPGGPMALTDGAPRSTRSPSLEVTLSPSPRVRTPSAPTKASSPPPNTRAVSTRPWTSSIRFLSHSLTTPPPSLATGLSTSYTPSTILPSLVAPSLEPRCTLPHPSFPWPALCRPLLNDRTEHVVAPLVALATNSVFRAVSGTRPTPHSPPQCSGRLCDRLRQLRQFATASIGLRQLRLVCDNFDWFAIVSIGLRSSDQFLIRVESVYRACFSYS